MHSCVKCEHTARASEHTATAAVVFGAPERSAVAPPAGEVLVVRVLGDIAAHVEVPDLGAVVLDLLDEVAQVVAVLDARVEVRAAVQVRGRAEAARISRLEHVRLHARRRHSRFMLLALHLTLHTHS